MVVERFRDGDARPVYERARDRGRMLPEGLRYLDSWVEANLGRCFQLMECDDLTLLMAWIARWADLVEFEVIPVVTSSQASAAVKAGESSPDQNAGAQPSSAKRR
jgi:hypothetical protein